MAGTRKRLAWLLAVLLLLSGCANKETEQPPTDPTSSPTVQPPSGNLICVEISRFNGVFVEDGNDEQVQEVAAILVENNTGKFLDLAMVTYEVGDRTATFKITGLPSGRRAWVLESNGMTLTPGEELVFKDCKETYNHNALETTDDLSVERQGKSLTVKNTSDKTLSNVVVYFKNTISAQDDTFFGGITYMMIFGELKPGESATQAKDHFGETSEIVRFSYQVK